MQEEKKLNSIFAICTASFVVLVLMFAMQIMQVAGVVNNSAQKEVQPKKVVISKQYDKGQSLKKAQATKKPMVIFFYTDWCGFCQRFAPTFHKVVTDTKIKKNFAVAYVNCELSENSEVAAKYSIEGYPTVIVEQLDGTKVHLENNTFFNEDSVKVVTENIMKTLKKEDTSEKK